MTGNKEQPLREVRAKACLAPGRRHGAGMEIWAVLAMVPCRWGISPRHPQCSRPARCLLHGPLGCWMLLQGEAAFLLDPLEEIPNSLFQLVKGFIFPALRPPKMPRASIRSVAPQPLGSYCGEVEERHLQRQGRGICFQCLVCQR